MTFPEAFQRTVARRPNAVALRAWDGDIRLTWHEYAAEVRRIAAGLAALGLRRGETFAAMLTNRPEFNLTEVAASHLGATTYSIYNTSSPEQVRFFLDHSRTRICVCERQFVERIRESGAALEHLLVLEDGDLDSLPSKTGFDFEATWRAVETDDVLCLIYTSGTTGPPKGVEHTHRGWLAMIESVSTTWPLAEGDSAISYLPSSHSGDRFYRHYYPLARGAEVITLADADKLPHALRDVRPTTFAAVPRTWEKLMSGVQRELRAQPDGAEALEAGAPGFLEDLRFRTGLDRVKWALTGTASIPEHVYAFWHRMGVQVVVGWGMTECGFGTGASASESKIGTVGKIAPGAEASIADDGELLVRMPWMMRGYRDDPVRTAEVLDPHGWLRTGDLATVDEDGTYRIVGRKKELIINAGGKNMSPSNIEHAISQGSPLVGPTMAVGDGRPYNVALITLDRDAARAFLVAPDAAADPVSLSSDQGVLAQVRESVHAGNQRLSRIEQVKRFVVLPTFWDPGGDEMTTTMKLKRAAITSKYAREIDALYTHVSAISE